MMGASQEAWFQNALATSPATWNVVANQVMVQRLKMERKGQTVYNMDQWDGYPAARKRLTDFLAARKPSNPVVVTGDTHETWVGNLVTDFDDPASAPIATELVGTSITSGGDGAVHAEFAQQELGENPHIVYENDRRGYFICDVTPASMTSELRTVDKVTTRDGLVTTTAKFRVESGRPGVQLA